MPFTLTMPKLSPTMEEGTIVKWHKLVGDHVEAGTVLFDVATDKATVEYQALDEGWLRKILVQEGSEAVVNQPIAIFTTEKDENFEGYQPQGINLHTKEEKTSVDISIDRMEVQKKGSHSPFETSETAMTTKSFLPGFQPEPPLENYTFEYPTERVEGRILASPLAKKIAKEKGLDLTSIKGSGPNQRVVLRDLENAQPSKFTHFSRRSVPMLLPGSYEEKPLSPLRKTLARRLQESKASIPHFYVTMPVNMDRLVNIREQLKIQELKLTINDFILRACALALREHPEINSGFNSVSSSIIQFKTIDIAVAVSIESGLITPIIRHADFKNLGEIALEIRSLARKAREGKLDPAEYKGGSITITNLGMYGVSEFQAILNPPQAAILAIGAVQDLPVVSGNMVVPGKVLNLTLSVDHRVIDGVAAALFLQTLKKLLENPAILLLG